MNEGREYRYQKDWSIGTTMFHVRCDDWEEFKTAVKNMEGILTQTAAFPNDTGHVATPQSKVQEVPMCGVHNVPMTWKTGVSKKTGRPYAFWSCGEMNNGMYCDYKVK